MVKVGEIVTVNFDCSCGFALSRDFLVVALQPGRVSLVPHGYVRCSYCHRLGGGIVIEGEPDRLGIEVADA